MSIHSSLRSGSGLAKHRNVLTRNERLVKLEDEGRWDASKTVVGLPKVKNLRLKAKKKEKKEKEGEEAEAAAAPKK